MLVGPISGAGTARQRRTGGVHMKISLALAGVVLMTAALTACGGDNPEDSAYCEDAKKAASTFKSFGDGDVAKADSAFATFHKLSDEAPDDVAKDWKKLDEVITTVENAFKDAGLKLSDLPDIQKGNIPKGVDISKLQSLGSEFQKLSDKEFTDAAGRIDAQAKKDCKVTLHVAS
jgi:hypothetical protein